MKFNVALLLVVSCVVSSLHCAEGYEAPVRVLSLTPDEVQEVYKEEFTYPSQEDLVNFFNLFYLSSRNAIKKTEDFALNHGGKTKTVGYALSHFPAGFFAPSQAAGHGGDLKGTELRRAAYFEKIFSKALFEKIKKAGLIGQVSVSAPLSGDSAQVFSTEPSNLK